MLISDTDIQENKTLWKKILKICDIEDDLI